MFLFASVKPLRSQGCRSSGKTSASLAFLLPGWLEELILFQIM
jgi:hypothetical protein